jgi:glycosyltransferase involved in cell wall biosynthesis
VSGRAPEMKILHVLNSLQPSGAETMLRLAAQPMLDRGMVLEVLSVGDRVGSYASTLAEAGYRVHHIPLQPVGSFLQAYARLLRRGRYDVVHVHPERANVLLAGFARSYGRAGVVRTVHSNFSFAGRLRLERRVHRAILRRMGVVHVAIGESVAASEWERFKNPTVTILNTFDEVRFSAVTSEVRRAARKAMDIHPETFVVSVVGNCGSVKNHEAAISALALLDLPDVQLLHVGLEDEASSRERQLADELGVLERIRFLGFVDDVPSVLHASDCFVMPSLYEGFGIAALETLGCGIPAVLADVPGLRDLKAFVPDAWWVQPEPLPLARAMAEVAALDGEARQRWGDGAAAAVHASLGVARHVEGYLRLYRSIARPTSRSISTGRGRAES